MIPFSLTPKMQARYDNCPLVARSERGGFEPRAQVQVSSERRMSYRLYTIGGLSCIVPAVWVRVMVPDFSEVWGAFDIVFERAIPRHELMSGGGVRVLSDEAFQQRVDAIIAQATAIAQAHREAE